MRTITNAGSATATDRANAQSAASHLKPGSQSARDAKKTETTKSQQKLANRLLNLTMKQLGKNPAAVALGRLGGSANTPAQNAARAKNAKKGGWPKGRPRKKKPTRKEV